MDSNDYLKIALKEVKYIEINEEFLVKDLFKGYMWNRIEKADRLRLGILFLNEIKKSNSLNLEILGKTSANQQKYKKIPEN